MIIVTGLADDTCLLTCPVRGQPNEGRGNKQLVGDSSLSQGACTDHGCELTQKKGTCHRAEMDGKIHIRLASLEGTVADVPLRACD